MSVDGFAFWKTAEETQDPKVENEQPTGQPGDNNGKAPKLPDDDAALAAISASDEQKITQESAGPAVEVGEDREVYLTDLGNARRLVARFKDRIRHIPAYGKWLVWDGKRWARDETGEIEQLAKATVDALWDDVREELDADRRKALVKHALRSQNAGRLQAMISVAQSEPGIPVKPDDLDQDPYLLNVQNGTLELRTGKLRPHRRRELITMLAGAPYQPEVPGDTWRAFLLRIFNGSDGLMEFVRRAVGYSLTGVTSERAMFIPYGIGANGKTTFITAVSAALGDYARQTPTETLMVKRTNQIPNDLARLKGGRFVSASESDEGQRLSESLIKQIAGGGDKITARYLHAEWFEFEPSFKVWLSTNHKPRIRGTDLAIWSRIRLVPFAITVPPAEQIKDLSNWIVENELPAVLAWAVEGCRNWQAHGLGESPEVTAATAEYREAEDLLADFLAQCCEIRPDAKVQARDLYQRYQQWAQDTGERIMGTRSFSQRFIERGFSKSRDKRAIWYCGLELGELV